MGRGAPPRFDIAPGNGERDSTAIEQPAVTSASPDGETLFRLMADAIPQIVWLTDKDARVEYLNAEWTRYTYGSKPNQRPVRGQPAAAAACHAADEAPRRCSDSKE